MAVYVAFSDESEVDQVEHPGGEFLLGGYVANEKEWPFASGAWQERVLDGPPEIPFLHMREIRDNVWREKHGISFNDAEERVSEAAKVMQSFGNIAAIVSSMRRSDLREIFSTRYAKHKNVPVGINEPDYLCFLAYAAHILGQVHMKWGDDAERIDFVVDRKKHVSHHCATFKDELKRLVDAPLRDLVGELIPLSKEDARPLQAADVLLWHIQRYYACGRDQKRMEPPDRLRLAQLTQDGKLDGAIHEWKRTELEHTAEKWEAAGLIPKPRTP